MSNAFKMGQLLIFNSIILHFSFIFYRFEYIINIHNIGGDIMFVYKTQGVCSTEIHLDIQDNIIKDVQFIRGCQGNLMGISALVKNMNINDVIAKLKGIECGKKSSSCPDQLSKALEEYLKKAE